MRNGATVDHSNRPQSSKQILRQFLSNPPFESPFHKEHIATREADSATRIAEIRRLNAVIEDLKRSSQVSEVERGGDREREREREIGEDLKQKEVLIWQADAARQRAANEIQRLDAVIADLWWSGQAREFEGAKEMEREMEEDLK